MFDIQDTSLPTRVGRDPPGWKARLTALMSNDFGGAFMHITDRLMRIEPDLFKDRQSPLRVAVMNPTRFHFQPVVFDPTPASPNDPAPHTVDPVPRAVDPALLAVDPALLAVDPALLAVDPALLAVDPAPLAEAGLQNAVTAADSNDCIENWLEFDTPVDLDWMNSDPNQGDNGASHACNEVVVSAFSEYADRFPAGFLHGRRIGTPSMPSRT